MGWTAFIRAQNPAVNYLPTDVLHCNAIAWLIESTGLTARLKILHRDTYFTVTNSVISTGR